MPRNRRASRAGLFLAGFAVMVTACTSGANPAATPAGSSATGGGGGGAVDDVLNLAFGADMGQPPDPDIFYEIEGNAVVTSVYEGLLRYEPDSPEIEPALAESYEVSDDGLTYTFTIREGVTFHDGTPLDAAAAKASFERRLDVDAGPAFMLYDVASMETPDDMTFVVTLEQPVSAFLHYLAAPYGPKMVSPTVLEEQGGDDFAQSYLQTADGGTGPFTISEFTVGQRIVLDRYDDYWGGAPDFRQVVISIIPDISTQRLQLEQGQLDMLMHGLTTSDIDSFRENQDFQVQTFPANFKNIVYLNENKGPFQDAALREAVRVSLDKAALTEQVYGERATPSTQHWPTGELSEGMASSEFELDPAALPSVVGGLSDTTVDLAYTNDDSTNQRMAELIQVQLQAAGLEVTVRGIPMAQAFDLPNQPDSAPHALVTTVNPDAAHPDAWGRIFNHTEGSLNWLACSVPEADEALDEGLRATTDEEIEAAYDEAGRLYAESHCWLDIADVQEVVVARAGIGGFTHQLPTLFTVRLGDLTIE